LQAAAASFLLSLQPAPFWEEIKSACQVSQPTHALTRLLASSRNQAGTLIKILSATRYLMQTLRADTQTSARQILSLPTALCLYHKRQHGIIINIVVDSQLLRVDALPPARA